MSKSSKPVPPLHALLGDSQVPVVQAAEGDVQYIKGFRSDLPFAHALTEDGMAIMPVVKILGGGAGPGPGGDSIEQGDGIKITTVGDKKVISTVVPISKKGSVGKHRHWRWTFPATSDPAATTISVNRLRAFDPSGANIPLSAAVVSASSESATAKATNLFLATDTATRWQTTGPAPAWVAVDVGAGVSVEVGSFQLRGGISAVANMPSKVTLEASANGIDWEVVASDDLTYGSDKVSQKVAVRSDQDIPAFIGEAPDDDKPYVRKNQDWEEAPEEFLIGKLTGTSTVGKDDLIPLAKPKDSPSVGWRLYLETNVAGEGMTAAGAINIPDIQFRTVAGGPTLTGGTLVASGTSSQLNAFDNNFNTSVTNLAGVSDFTIGKQFPDSHRVVEVAIWSHATEATRQKFPGKFKIQRQETTSSPWVDVASFDITAGGVGALPAGGWMVFSTASSNSYDQVSTPVSNLIQAVKDDMPDPASVVEAGVGVKVDSSVPGKVTVSTDVPISKAGGAGKHRFWRWAIHSNYGHAQVALSFVTITDTSSVVIPVVRDTDTAFTDRGAAHPVGNALYSDATPTSFWETQAGATYPIHFGVEFAEPKEIGSFSFRGQYSNERPREITFQFSDDGINYADATDKIDVIWTNLVGSPVAVGNIRVPRFPTFPPKDGGTYAMKDEEWVEHPEPENGTWTPAITTATASDLTATYTQQAGVYSKVGTLVTVTGRIAFTPDFTGTPGALRIAGLPFTSRSQSGVVSVGNIVGANVDLPEGASIIVGATGHSSNFIGLITSTPGGPYLTLNAETALESGRSSELRFSISYEV